MSLREKRVGVEETFGERWWAAILGPFSETFDFGGGLKVEIHHPHSTTSMQMPPDPLTGSPYSEDNEDIIEETFVQILCGMAFPPNVSTIASHCSKILLHRNTKPSICSESTLSFLVFGCLLPAFIQPPFLVLITPILIHNFPKPAPKQLYKPFLVTCHPPILHRFHLHALEPCFLHNTFKFPFMHPVCAHGIP